MTNKTTISKYKDVHGSLIKYGDILKSVEPIIKNRTEFDVAEPFFKLVLLENKPMMYVSGVDEYHKIKDYQHEDDGADTLKAFEIVMSEVLDDK